MDEKELFRDLINGCISIKDMTSFHILVVRLISDDNNIEDEDIEENCRLLNVLIDVLENYKDVSEFQMWIEKLKDYAEILDDV